MCICKNCGWWDEKESLYANKGICLLSTTDNPYMEAGDEILAYNPYLETDENFGCNQYKAKEDN